MAAKLKLRSAVRFLASIFSGTGTSVRKDGLATYIDMDWTNFSPVTSVSSANKSATYLGMQYSLDGSYSKINYQDFASGVTSQVIANSLDVFLIIGDSNAVGLGDSTSSPTVQVGRALMYCADGIIRDANDPTKSAVASAQDANTGSMWPALGIAYGRRVGFVLTGKSGTTQTSAGDLGAGNWDTAGSLYSGSLTALNAALTAFTAAGYATIFRGVIYVCGNNDAAQINAAVINVGQYTTALTTMVANYRAATIGGVTYPHLPFYLPIIGTSIATSDAGYSQVRAAQLAYAATDGNTFVPFVDLMSFSKRSLIASGPHLTQAGYNLMGKQIGASLVPTIPANIPFKLFNANAGIGTAAPTGTVLHVVGADNVSPLITVDGYGTAAGQLQCRQFGGTASAPTATTSGSALGVIGVFGYGTTGFSTASNGGLFWQATQDHTDTAHGTSFSVRTTPNGSITPATALFVDQDKTVTLSAYGVGSALFNSSGKISSETAADQQARLSTTCLQSSVAINFAVSGDTAIPIPLPTGFTQIRIIGMVIDQASATLVAGTFGVFTTTGGGGLAIVAAGTAITVTNNTANTTNNMQFVAAGAPNTIATTPSGGNLQFRVGTTAAGTGKFTVLYHALP